MRTHEIKKKQIVNVTVIDRDKIRFYVTVTIAHLEKKTATTLKI